MIQNSLGEKLK